MGAYTDQSSDVILQPPLVIVIILVWNGALWLRECIGSLLETNYQNYRILVVDNGSFDDSVNIARSYRGVQIIENNYNYGYAEGNNIGIRAALDAGAQYVALLNQDLKVDKDWLAGLLDIMVAHDELGVISPFQFTYDKQGIDKSFSKLSQEQYLPDLDGVFLVSRVIGAAALYKREVLVNVGGFDPTYFLYHEESDLCRRVLFHGYKIAVYNKCIVYHWNSMESGTQGKRATYLYLRNKAMFLLKNPALPMSVKLKQYLYWGEAKKIASDILKKVGVWGVISSQVWLLVQLPSIYIRVLREQKIGRQYL